MRFVSVQINTALTVVSAFENTFCFNFKVHKAENNHTGGSVTHLIALDILVVSLGEMVNDFCFDVALPSQTLSNYNHFV